MRRVEVFELIRKDFHDFGLSRRAIASLSSDSSTSFPLTNN
jgi:hypothetical protein